jgi:thiamine biosynthesis lipoprotein
MNRPPQETCFVNPDVHRGALIEGMKRFSHEAMATTFELLIVHEDERYAAQAAVAAFDEVDRLERELSRFLENSDVTRINNLPANQPLQLGLDTFECLKIAQRVYAETNGAFDITIGTLLKCWRNDDGSPRKPSSKEIDLARMHTGTNLIQLNETEHRIMLSASPVQVDLGGIGKGYAVDRVAELLRDWSIDVALVSGGYSSVLALDAPPGKKGCEPRGIHSHKSDVVYGWPLTMTNPAPGSVQGNPAGNKATTGRSKGEILARPLLKNAALSGSGVQKGGHIIDPRTARAVKGRLAAWSSASDATTADALSTAFMIMDLDEIKKYCGLHPNTLALVVVEDGTPRGVSHCGEGKNQSRQKIFHFGQWEKVLS